MKYRTAPILNAVDPGAAGTRVIDINLESALSAIDIKWSITKGASGMDAPDVADITRIELVDGSERLFSLTGYEAQALNYYNRPGRQMSKGEALTAMTQESHYIIDFGRRLWDPDLAFDPKRHVNPQLRITFNYRISDTAATARELEITGFIFDEKQPSPRGFLSAIEEYSYTAGGNLSYEIIELPDDRMVRQLLVRAYQTDKEPWYNINEARLDENNLGRIVFDYTNLENYNYMMNSWEHQIMYNVDGRADAGGNNFYVPVTDYWASFVLSAHAAAPDVFVQPSAIAGGLATVVSATGQSFRAIVKGSLPWHCFRFPFGDPDDPDDWWDPKGNHPRLRLRVGAAGDACTAMVVMEELRPY